MVISIVKATKLKYKSSEINILFNLAPAGFLKPEGEKTPENTLTKVLVFYLHRQETSDGIVREEWNTQNMDQS